MSDEQPSDPRTWGVEVLRREVSSCIGVDLPSDVVDRADAALDALVERVRRAEAALRVVYAGIEMWEHGSLSCVVADCLCGLSAARREVDAALAEDAPADSVESR